MRALPPHLTHLELHTCALMVGELVLHGPKTLRSLKLFNVVAVDSSIASPNSNKQLLKLPSKLQHLHYHNENNMGRISFDTSTIETLSLAFSSTSWLLDFLQGLEFGPNLN